jgi:hypothetical protein
MKKIFTKHYLLGLLFFIWSNVERHYQNNLSATFLNVVAIAFFVIDLIDKIKNREKK